MIHFKDRVLTEENKRKFTEVTFKKFLDCRKEWSLDKEYKGFVTVARESLDKVPVDAADIHQIQNRTYHVSCYQLFTNISKLERAKNSKQQDESVADEPQSQSCSSSLSCNRRKSARTFTKPTNYATNNQANFLPVSFNILPKVCIICKKSGPIFVKDNKSRKRIRQGLSQAQTIKAGLLYDTAVSKEDEDILLQIRDKDCVAIEVKYHKQCYSRYTKHFANTSAKIVEDETTNEVMMNPFDKFCEEIITTRIINGEEIFTLKKLNELYINKFTKENTSINITSSSRLKEKLRQKFKSQLIFHPSKAKNKSDLVYADYITPGVVIESAVVPDDISSTMDDSSQDEGPHTNNFSFKRSCNLIENRELYYSAIYLNKLIMTVNTNISWPPDSNDLTYENACEVFYQQSY